MAINIGFPTLIPMLIMFAFNLLSSFLSPMEVEYHTENNYQRNPNVNARSNTNAGSRTGGGNAYSTRSTAAAAVEDDYSGYKFLVVLLLFIGLPMLIRRIMRN